MQLSWLADALRAEGLTVEEHVGWLTRTMRPFDEYTPVGLINHHTAGSSILTDYPDAPYYRDSALQTKCNLTIRGDGTVVVLNAGWAADSGFGDRKVLAAVQLDQPAPPPSDTYSSTSPEVVPGGPNPGILGNRWYIDIEVQHLGNGDPIAPPQRDALIRSNVAICRQMKWDPATRLIGHREWSTRKQDPRWDGKTNPMPGIRADTAALLNPQEDDMAGFFVKKGDTGDFPEYWQRVMVGIDSAFKPKNFREWDATAIAELVKLTGPGTDIGPGEAADLHKQLGAKGAPSTIDPTARANAAAAHERLNKLHTV